jgi:hypothetical protein
MDAAALLTFSLAVLITLDVAAARIGHGPTRRPARSRRG